GGRCGWWTERWCTFRPTGRPQPSPGWNHAPQPVCSTPTWNRSISEWPVNWSFVDRTRVQDNEWHRVWQGGIAERRALMHRKRRTRLSSSASIVAALDVGTHKISCLIAALEPPRHNDDSTVPRLATLGFGHQRSQGIDAGAVIDLAQARNAVSAAV